jgi:UDP-N-acetylmuramate dehydrogenase
LNNHLVYVEAGAWMADVAEFALKNSLSGIEMFWDIPSSLGGAVVMNAGASGDEIKDVIQEVRYFDLKAGIRKVLSAEELNFQYRNSFFQMNSENLIFSAILKLRSAKKEAIKKKMEEIKTNRELKQPKEYPNAGSVFKRPKGFYVGSMIEELGLKGYTVGGMKISEKHGGFIVNFNNGTGEDVVKIIHYVQNCVHKVYGLELEIEQRIL